MGQKTKIHGCDSTCNSTMGCDGCELWTAQRRVCYAGILHNIRGGNPGFAPTFGQVTLFPGRMAEAARWSDLRGKPRPDKPWLDGMPRLILISDMSDVLSKAVGFEFLEAEIIRAVTSNRGQRHLWKWPTKRPGRMAEFARWLRKRGTLWPRNLWAGTSVTSSKNVCRVNELLRVGDENTVRFISLEPQWEAVDFGDLLPQVDWVLQGGQSGPKAEPFELEWARTLRCQCREVGVAYFLKQFGASPYDGGTRLRLQNRGGGD